MTPFEQIEKRFVECMKAGDPKPPAITLPPLYAEMFLREAMKRKPWYVTMKPGKITYRGSRVHVITEEEYKEAKVKYRHDHPIEVPEAPKIIIPGEDLIR